MPYIIQYWQWQYCVKAKGEWCVSHLEEKSGVVGMGERVAFTRYWNAHNCMVYSVKTGGRKEVDYCAIVLR